MSDAVATIAPVQGVRGWREIPGGRCPVCGEQHIWEWNHDARLVSCGWTEVVQHVDELPAGIAVQLAWRFGGIR